MKKLLLLIPALLLVTTACGKGKEDEASKKAMELSNFAEGEYKPPVPAPLPDDMVLEVPDSVKAKYSVVILGVGNRKTRKGKKFNVKIGGSAQVPGTDFKIQVMSYLPEWAVRGKVVTSKSDLPNDPAVRAVIFEKDKKVFDGFLFQRHLTPSFMTDTWAIGLLGAS